MDSSDSNSDCFEIRHKGKAMASSSLLTRKHDNDDNVPRMKEILRTRKILKTLISSSPTAPKMMTWSKNDELVILRGILDYDNGKKLSHNSDWDAFGRYIKDSIVTSFSKKQLTNKVENLKRRFTSNQARSKDGKGPSFSDPDEEKIFKLSKIIWETECASNQNMDQKAEKVPDLKHERVSNMVGQAKVATKNETECASNENFDQANVLVLNKDLPCVEHERVSNISMEIGNGEKEKEKSEEDGVDEFCVLQEALEEATLFQSLGRNQQKLLIKNLKSLEAETRKELTGEWEALLLEEVQLKIKKQAFSAKLANPPRQVSA